MNKSEIVKELNTLRLVLNDLIGDTDIGEHYIDVLGKSLFLVGSSKWEYSSDHFTIKCDEIAGNVNVSMGGGSSKSPNKKDKKKIKPIKTTDPKSTQTQTSTNNTPRSNGDRPSLVASSSSNSSNIRPNIPVTDRMRNM